MITCRRLSECPLAEAVQAYNRGFTGYFFDQSKTVDQFVFKLGKEELSPALSIVAYDDGEPVGIVLNGFRQIDGKKVAWNGGTGVAPEWRRRGVGRLMMEETLSIYREQEAELAALVAIKENEQAIKLYQRAGFAITGQSIFLESRDALTELKTSEQPYQIQHVPPQAVYTQRFWPKPLWQIQWETISDKEGLLVTDERQNVIGCALYRRIYQDDQSPTPVTTLLFDCVADPAREDAESIIRHALAEIFSPLDACFHRITVNLPSEYGAVKGILNSLGFTRMAEQVFMARNMNP